MTDETHKAAAEATEAIRLLRHLLEDENANPSGVAARLAMALGILCRETGSATENVEAAGTIVETSAGVIGAASMGQLMPCPACWQRLLRDASEREHTGTALTYCEHRGLAVEIAAEKGEVTAWHLKPATAEELEEFKRQKTRAQFRESGLKRVH